MQNRSV